ncbi:MAG: ATP-binding protein [Acidobacteria bacterium]|nr:ATP-binding protein [Acidobacteriota bacterium]
MVMTQRARGRQGNIRIVVTGAQCTGKTTLCHSLERALGGRGYHCSVIGEVARIIAAQGFPLDKECTLETYYAFITGHVNNLMHTEKRLLIYDRFIVDFFAYVRANANVPLAFDNMMIAVSKLCLQKADRILYVPIEIPLVADGLRNTDSNYQVRVDHELRKLLDDLGAEYVEIKGNLSGRVQQAMESIMPLLP